MKLDKWLLMGLVVCVYLNCSIGQYGLAAFCVLGALIEAAIMYSNLQ